MELLFPEDRDKQESTFQKNITGFVFFSINISLLNLQENTKGNGSAHKLQ